MWVGFMLQLLQSESGAAGRWRMSPYCICRHPHYVMDAPGVERWTPGKLLNKASTGTIFLAQGFILFSKSGCQTRQPDAQPAQHSLSDWMLGEQQNTHKLSLYFLFQSRCQYKYAVVEPDWIRVLKFHLVVFPEYLQVTALIDVLYTAWSAWSSAKSTPAMKDLWRLPLFAFFVNVRCLVVPDFSTFNSQTQNKHASQRKVKIPYCYICLRPVDKSENQQNNQATTIFKEHFSNGSFCRVRLRVK